MFCNCKNCDHSAKHGEGLFCQKGLIFVNPHDGCDDFYVEKELSAWGQPIFYLAIGILVSLILINIFS
jgi:hypothetical protein